MDTLSPNYTSHNTGGSFPAKYMTWEANLQQWKYRAVKTNKKHLSTTLNHDKNTTVGFLAGLFC